MYQYSIVTFLDILGFRELVLKSDPEKLSKILQLVEYLSGLKDEKHEYSPFVFCFSDSVISGDVSIATGRIIKMFELSLSGVSLSVKRGEKIAHNYGYELIDP